MMGLAIARKKKPSLRAERNEMQPARLQGDGLFYRHTLQVAGISRKEAAYENRVSHTMMDFWIHGEKSDPFTMAKRNFGFITLKYPGLKAAILAYIAGGDDGLDEVLMARMNEVFSKAAVKPATEDRG